MKKAQIQINVWKALLFVAIIFVVCVNHQAFAGCSDDFASQKKKLNTEYNNKIDILTKQLEQDLIVLDSEHERKIKALRKKYNCSIKDENEKINMGSFLNKAQKNLNESVEDPNNLKQSDLNKMMGIE